MARTNFETLRVYQLAEEVADLVWEIARLKEILDELAPRLNAYINTLKRKPRTTNNEPRTTNDNA